MVNTAVEHADQHRTGIVGKPPGFGGIDVRVLRHAILAGIVHPPQLTKQKIVRKPHRQCRRIESAIRLRIGNVLLVLVLGQGVRDGIDVMTVQLDKKGVGNVVACIYLLRVKQDKRMKLRRVVGSGVGNWRTSIGLNTSPPV